MVTGANSGIGLEFVRQLLARNNKVVATIRQSCPALEALKSSHGDSLVLTSLDQCDQTSITAWVRDLKAKAITPDFVLNNAGVYGKRGRFGEFTQEDLIFPFQVNTVGVLLVVQELVSAGLLKPGALIGNMSSKMGSMADNGSGGSYAYRASKAAQNAISKSMAIDLKRDLDVTTVLLHPGYVRTRMTGGEGLIDVEECVSGLLAVIESDRELNGRWYDFAGKEIPF